MIVVADTTPLNYLILIDEIRVLRSLYQHIIIPPAVHAELLASQAPQQVQTWASVPPTWVEVRTPSLPLIPVSSKLGIGEHEAITLAQSLRSPLLLIDEVRGRREATRLGIRVTGTLGILHKRSKAASSISTKPSHVCASQASKPRLSYSKPYFETLANCDRPRIHPDTRYLSR